MADDNTAKTHPLDPTQDASDLMGDTTGMTGITTGGASTASSDQNDTGIDSMSPTRAAQIADQGSEADNVTGDTPGHVGGPTPQMNAGFDTSTPADTSGLDDSSDDATSSGGNQASDSGGIDLATPATAGEQSVSGDMPDPDSDDDTLSNAQAVGTQLGEDSENPQALDIARDIDNAEESLRTH